MNKKKRKFKLKKILFLVVLITTYVITLKLLNKINLDIKNDNFYKYLINNSSSISETSIISFDKFKSIFSLKPASLLDNNLVYSNDNKDVLAKNDKDIVDVVQPVEKEEPTEEEKNEIKEEDKSPIVYIYNTHQTENYSSENLAEYSITPNVMIADYMLKENLEKYGIYSYVEEDSVSNVLSKNNWKYASSYKVTKQFMQKRSKEMPTIKYYIDLHRDSVKKQYTTTQINGISYAKVMLLVGLDHDNYQVNLKEAKKINDMLNKEYPGLSRGIYKKSGKGVNGIYNQDFSKYTFLFEIGGVDNNIEEVNNTIIALTKILAQYINEEEKN